MLSVLNLEGSLSLGVDHMANSFPRQQVQLSDVLKDDVVIRLCAAAWQ